MRYSTKMGLLALSALSAGLLSQTAAAHGYAEYPASRAEFCDQDGGYWDSQDGSTIPNAACRAAYLDSGAFQFYQKPEFAKLVSNYNSISAVKAAIPGTTLCSANDSAKSGTSLAHPDWQKTTIDTSVNGGVIQYTYRANTPHSPSFWEFYISKPGFDSATQGLSWDDLELIQENGNTPTTDINGKKYYVIDLQLPTNRSGDAVLYSRWQRNDPAGEGFYNCSDITFAGDVVEPTWYNQGSLLSSQDDAVAGDEVWGRVFNAQGQEIVFEKLAIDSSNEAEVTWAATLANSISNANSNVSVGVLDANGNVQFDGIDIYANRVYSRNNADSYQLTIRPPVVGNTAPTATLALSANSIDVGGTLSATVTLGDVDSDQLTVTVNDGQGNISNQQVTGPNYNNVVVNVAGATAGNYQVSVTVSDGQASVNANQNYTVNQPTTGECVDPNAGNYPTWVPGTYTNQTLSHNGLVYQAKWWTSAEPGTDGSWRLISNINLPWDANSIYNSGDEVDHGASRYKAAHWTQGNNPDNGGVWSRIGAAQGC